MIAVAGTPIMIERMASSPPPVSIIVPVFEEAPNVKPLAERVAKAMSESGRAAELIFVDDDSRDGIDQVVDALQLDLSVRLIVRRGERGLSGAVLRGFREAVHDRFVVMDGDLQHPPELITALLDALDQDDTDFVLATRYVADASVAAQWPLIRRIISRVATRLAQPLAPLSDPMSGFFALHRRTWEQADPLDPIGYKIALELYVKGKCKRPREVPIQFGTRQGGKSKLGMGTQVRYLRHLYRLYRYRFPQQTLMVVFVVAVLGGAGLLALLRPLFERSAS